VLLFPNPVDDELTLKLDAGFSANTYLTLYNSLGKTIMKETLQGNEHILNLNALPGGVYVIGLTGDRGIIIRKIIKN
jgi:hypothetical protein